MTVVVVGKGGVGRWEKRFRSYGGFEVGRDRWKRKTRALLSGFEDREEVARGKE